MAVDVAATLDLLTQWGYAILFLVAVFESLPFLGVLFPGSAVVVLAGALASQGSFTLGWVILLSAVASMAGDALGYWLGGRHGRGILLRLGARFAVTEHHIDRAETLFNKYGPVALVVARFNFITRGLAPFLAGMSRMTPWLFWVLNFSGSLLWAAAYAGLGFVFGAGFLYLEGRLGRILVVSLATAAGIFLLYRALRKSGAHFTRYDGGLAAVGVGAAIGFGRLAHLIRRGDALAVDLLLDPVSGALGQALPLFRALTLLGDPLVVGALTVTACIGLAARKLGWEALLLAAAMVGERLLVGALKLALARPRPPGGLVAETSFSFPSGHVTISLVFLGTLLYVLALGRPRPVRLGLSAVAGVLAAGVALSRLALRVHYPSDVLGGLLVGAAWLAVVLLVGEWIEKGPIAERRAARAARPEAEPQARL